MGRMGFIVRAKLARIASLDGGFFGCYAESAKIELLNSDPGSRRVLTSAVRISAGSYSTRFGSPLTWINRQQKLTDVSGALCWARFPKLHSQPRTQGNVGQGAKADCEKGTVP
jgi:hypothetical protein